MARLLFDEPLSEELCHLTVDLFPDALHVRLLGHGGASDVAVRELARERGCIVVSKDGDFHRLALLARCATKVHLDSFGKLSHGGCRGADPASLR